MAEIGKINQLKVIKKVDFGIYLDGDTLGEILLPRKCVPQNCKIDSMVEVFIYRDSEDRIIATTQKPFAMVGEFALLKVVSASTIGAFLDWGLPKDLLVPFREQRQKMRKGRSYMVYIYLDKQTGRIVGSSKLDKFLGKLPVRYREGQRVALLVDELTDIGYKAIINNTHWGILYKNEVFQPLKKGQLINGFIKKVRCDEKIDLSLTKAGLEKVDHLAAKIILDLNEKGGVLTVSDASSPEEIYAMFGVSKKTFKKAIGALYKKRLIRLEKDRIKLNKPK